MLVNKGFQFCRYYRSEQNNSSMYPIKYILTTETKFFNKISSISGIDTLLKQNICICISYINTNDESQYNLEFNQMSIRTYKHKLKDNNYNFHSPTQKDNMILYLEQDEKKLKNFLGYFLDFMFEVFPIYEFTEREIEYLKEYHPNHLIWLYEKPKETTLELNSTKQLSLVDKINQIHADFTFLRAQKEWNTNISQNYSLI